MCLVLFHLGCFNFFLHEHVSLDWRSVDNFRDALLRPKTDTMLNFTMINHSYHIFQPRDNLDRVSRSQINDSATLNRYTLNGEYPRV